MRKYSLKILLEDAATDFDAESAIDFYGSTDSRIKKSLSKSLYHFSDEPKSGDFQPQYPGDLAGQIANTAPPIEQVTGEDFENLEQKTRVIKGKPVKDERENIKKVKATLNRAITRDLPTKTLSVGSETFVIPHKNNMFGNIYGHIGRRNPIYRDLFRMAELYKDYVSMGSTAIGDFYEDLASGVFGFGNTNIARRDSSGTKKSEFADVFGDDTFFSVKGSESKSDGLSSSRVKIKSMFTFLNGRPGKSAQLGIIEGGRGWGGRSGRRVGQDHILFHMRKSSGVNWTLNDINLSLDDYKYYTCGTPGKTPILVRRQGDSFTPVDGVKVKYIEKEVKLLKDEGIEYCDSAAFGSSYGLKWHRDDGWHWGSFMGSKSWVANVTSNAEIQSVFVLLPNVTKADKSLRRSALESVPDDERQDYRADQWADREAPDWASEAYFPEHDMHAKGYIDRSEIKFIDLTPENKEKYKEDYRSWELENENAYQAAKELSLDKGRLADKVKTVFQSFERIDPIKAKTLQDLIDEIHSMLEENRNVYDLDLLVETKVLEYLKQVRYKNWSTGRR